MPTAPWRISIIIATTGRLPSLRETLLSLAKVWIPEEFLVEVLLVENGSQQGAKELLVLLPPDRFSSKYLFEPLIGKSRALNSAMAQAAGNILLFTDDDVRFPHKWIVEMCRPLIEGEGSVVIGGARIAPELQKKWMNRYHRGFLASTEYLSDKEPSEFAGINWACLRSVFSKVPEFDRELGGGGLGNAEDCLLAQQLKQAGCLFVSRTNVLVEHFPDKSRLCYRSWIRAAEQSGRSRAYVLYHWQHKAISFPFIRLLYFRLKLLVRLFFSRRYALDEEGISAWELSYRVDIAKLEQYLRERSRPKNYSYMGFRKLDVLQKDLSRQ